MSAKYKNSCFPVPLSTMSIIKLKNLCQFERQKDHNCFIILICISCFNLHLLNSRSTLRIGLYWNVGHRVVKRIHKNRHLTQAKSFICSSSFIYLFYLLSAFPIVLWVVLNTGEIKGKNTQSLLSRPQLRKQVCK